jgi:hypothetical protein
MEFKGTKGKWDISRCQISEQITINAGLFNIANVFCYDILCGTNDIEEAYYNSLLISKAPEMLEMLEKIMKTYDKGTQTYLECEQLIKEATEL